MKKVLIVGGGAAGMMAAIGAADSGNKVCLIEKNEKLGKKLFLTGKGRCNVTNAGDADTFFSNVCTNNKFLYSAFYGYDNFAVMNFLEQAGCPLKTERGGRVFPISDHSSDVIAAFGRELRKRGVEILLNTEVQEVLTNEGMITGVRLQDGKILYSECVIVCTGGLSYPSTGSTGDGYRFAKETGHRVTECVPSLVPFEVMESWCSKLMGLSLKNVSVRLICGSEEWYQGFGEMLFTHFGVSGPLILSASSFYGKKGKKDPAKKQNFPEREEVKLHIDLKPALDAEQLDKRLLREFEENKNRQFKNSLGGLFPAKLIPVMVELSGILPERKVNDITREERRAFGKRIKDISLTVTGVRGFSEAIITKGGIHLKEINASTMESKKVKGLYFAGEVLDLDALTGGFNLQIAWSTGYLAGSRACR
ncbi:MAG: NAD(P)/FAD-dependent oxidoreductase [Lachnospiraceae bacterium]|nr:NAD(P)/FAD-dependent oxidoreductase [Lachnospiraceae bacterium]